MITERGAAVSDREKADRFARYDFQGLSKAMHILVTGEKDARNRVFTAGRLLMLIDPEVFRDPDVRSLLRTIKARLTRNAPELPGETSLDATFRRTRNSTASKIAELAFDAYLRQRDLEHAQIAERRAKGRKHRGG